MTTTTQALEQYIAYAQRTRSKWFAGQCKYRVGAFLKLAKVAHVDEILHAHINQFVERYRENGMHRTYVRGFLRWCKERYCPTVPQIPYAAYTPRKPGFRKIAQLARVDKAREHAAHAASRMTLPHQRAIFLLGYLYGFQLARICALTRADVRGLPMRPDIYRALDETMRTCAGPALIFSPYLTATPSEARKRWLKWVEPEKVDFREVVWAGQAARLQAGMAPQVQATDLLEMAAALPGLSEEGLRRMPEFWR